MLRALTCLMAVLAALPVLAADPASIVNVIRMQGCGGQPGVGAAVRSSATLDGVARQLSRGGQLSAALEHGHYTAASSASIHIEGTNDATAIERIFRDQYCATVNNLAFWSTLPASGLENAAAGNSRRLTR